jgi:serine/threonine protein kinase
MSKYYCVDDGPYFRSLEFLIDYYMRYQDGFPYKLRSLIPSDSVYCQNLPKVESEKGTIKETKKFKRHKIKLDGPKKLSERKPKENFKDIKLENVLGEGEFGTVYKAILNGKKQVAVKMLKDLNAFKDFEREAEIMNNIGNHPCIVKIFGIIKEKDKFMIIQELLVCSLLDKLYQTPRVITEYNLKSWSVEIVSGMDHLEQKKIVHRDLAARNILLGSNLQAKISDFGLSRTYEDEYTQTKDYKIPIKWYAPESIERSRFTSKSDVWSFGIMLWEMWSYGDIPYGEKNGEEVYDFIRVGKRLRKPDHCLNSTYSIMEKCWDWNEETRPSFKDLMEIFKELTSDDNDYSDVKNIYM